MGAIGREREEREGGWGSGKGGEREGGWDYGIGAVCNSFTRPGVCIVRECA